jgi:hypothetical protein
MPFLFLVALGLAGAVAMALDADHRIENISFGIGAGFVCGGLVWLDYALGRISRRSVRPA